MVRSYESECVVPGCNNLCWKEVCQACGRKIRTGTLPPMGGVNPNPPCEVDGCKIPRSTTKAPYCRGHYEFNRSGKIPASMRPKVQNGKPKPPCNDPDCNNPASSKGLCKTHYVLSRYVPVRSECITDGCNIRTSEGHCAKHREQLETYGFTWEGKRPHDRIREWRRSQNPECDVLNCEEKTTSRVSRLCSGHRADFKRKNCDLEFYLGLKGQTTCESCGKPGRLVVDHDHSCEHARDGMCQSCIRGVLCSGCNTSLGLLREDPETVMGLLHYLETRVLNRG